MILDDSVQILSRFYKRKAFKRFYLCKAFKIFYKRKPFKRLKNPIEDDVDDKCNYADDNDVDYDDDDGDDLPNDVDYNDVDYDDDDDYYGEC